MKKKIFLATSLIFLFSFINTALPYHLYKLKDFSALTVNSNENNQDEIENEDEEFIKQSIDLRLSAGFIFLENTCLITFSSLYFFSFAKDVVPPPRKYLA